MVFKHAYLCLERTTVEVELNQKLLQYISQKVKKMKILKFTCFIN